MISTVPEIVLGVTRGDSEAWERARSLLADYYSQEYHPRITFFSLSSKFSPSFPLHTQADDSSSLAAYRLRACDLLALRNLDIKVDHKKLNELFSCEPLPELMAQIPTETELVDISPQVFTEASGALPQVWATLTKDPLALKPKAAAALLARLRPAALPLFTKDDRQPWGEVSDYVQFCLDLHDLLLAEHGRLAHQLYYLREALALPEWISQIQLLQALVFLASQEQRAAKKEQIQQEKAEEKLRKKEAKHTKKQRKKFAKKQAVQSKAQKLAEEKAQKAQRAEDEKTEKEGQGIKPSSDPRHLGSEEPTDLGNSRAARGRRGRHVRDENSDDSFISTDPVSLPR